MEVYNCYVKGCEKDSRHSLKLDDFTIHICGDHYDDAKVMLDNAQDKILKEKRDVSKAIRCLK